MDFDGTNHLFIEAENLEALKILQKAYAGSVKMIYIDPPYNTGSDSFIYPDKFSETREEYARRVGDKDDEGYLKRDGVFQGAWRKNSKESGHYHSNWLSMMLPRLHLAKTLLRDDGVIFISIDDNEQAQLKLLCDEVFGAENFVTELIRKTKSTTNDAKTGLNLQHEACLVFAKNKTRISLLGGEKDLRRYANPDNDPNGDWISDNPSAKSGRTENNHFAVINPYTGKKDYPPTGRFWLFSKNTIQKHIDYGTICFKKEHGENERGFIFKRYKKDLKTNQKTLDSLVFCGNEFMNQTATKELLAMELAEYFSYPKGVSFLKTMIEHGTDEQGLILDFFSGSGTTAHAVMQLNAEDGGNRRYICVQLPEETDEKSEARKVGFDTIAEIAKERIRRAGRQIREQHPEKTVDTGFKVFKLAESHFKQWRPSENGSDGLEAQLAMFIDPVAEHVEPLNMAYELMLRLGLKLTCPLHGSDGVYWVEDEDTGKRTSLLLTRADERLIDAVIAENPAKVVALDRLFDGNDSLKSNTVLQMRDAGIVFECV
ncbi:site-specific DNA-methyltransferase [Neisseria weaveri]|uniref:site-specific DNA-methyltransferase n=1 Tax=Neisseria weaveri TaxID=28091 RepID=UPI000D2FFC7F|nr:site-specific DNA-methyltransferase [Neisseria weaveri]